MIRMCQNFSTSSSSASLEDQRAQALRHVAELTERIAAAEGGETRLSPAGATLLSPVDAASACGLALPAEPEPVVGRTHTVLDLENEKIDAKNIPGANLPSIVDKQCPKGKRKHCTI